LISKRDPRGVNTIGPRGMLNEHRNSIEQGTCVKKLSNIRLRSLLCAMAGVLTVLIAATGSRPAAAQASDAADRCTEDVMRLCNEFIPDADRIVVCLKSKRKQLTPSCLSALQPKGGSRSARRHHKS
jgi:hypothetical protein